MVFGRNRQDRSSYVGSGSGANLLHSSVYYPYPTPFPYPQAEKQAKGYPMENLYQIVAVSREREILCDELVVAEDAQQAQYGVSLGEIMKKKKLQPKDVTVLALKMGEVRVKPEPTEVTMVEGDKGV